MEGPSLVIASEEFEKYVGQKIRRASGSLDLPYANMKSSKLTKVTSWGKHFLLIWPGFALRVHFLMFGSYRINNPREGRVPKLALDIGGDQIEFYSCAIKEISADIECQYDWSIDIMSDQWKPTQALARMRGRGREMVCDLLMDQSIFSGLGNIMKNEILFKRRMHPETRFAALDAVSQRKLVAASRAYAKQFYLWKKAGVLKRNWNVFRKKTCPVCERKVTKKPTGRGKRFSHFCRNCQALQR